VCHCHAQSLMSCLATHPSTLCRPHRALRTSRLRPPCRAVLVRTLLISSRAQLVVLVSHSRMPPLSVARLATCYSCPPLLYVSCLGSHYYYFCCLSHCTTATIASKNANCRNGKWALLKSNKGQVKIVAAIANFN
jgi:hypothetical protein